MSSKRNDNRFFGTLPTRGIWTALDLPRMHFAAIVVLTVAAFVFIDGPIWRHPHDQHLRRIVISYVLIPVLIGISQWSLKRRLAIAPLFAGTLVIGAIKLVVTALLTLVVP